MNDSTTQNKDNRQENMELHELLREINETPPPMSSTNMFPNSTDFNDIVLNGLGGDSHNVEVQNTATTSSTG